jgi:hypothetical protein
MKNSIKPATAVTIVFTAAIFLFSGCYKDDKNTGQTQTYTIYTPVYKAKASVLAAINGNKAQSIEHAGKIYTKDNFIYLNDVNKGIHIIDNSNTASPVQIAFLSIPGNLDIAIKENILYADMYNDLLALDITNPHHAVITSTLSNFFSGRGYVNGFSTNTGDQVAVDWKQKDTTVFTDQTPRNCDFCQFDFNAVPGVKSSSKGVAGSMAGMVLMNDYLYAITEMHSLGIVDVSNAKVPKLDSAFFAGYDLQTIFPFEDKLFLGSAIGMFMFDVSDPEHPSPIGEFAHGRACDPVISDGSYAYVTLHAGDGCGGDANELHVIDIKDIRNSKLVKSYKLTKPTGLSKDGDLLFVCDGDAVKIYNAANPDDLKLLQLLAGKDPYDIIAADNKAMLVCNDGLYQYDYSNISHIRLLSFLPAKK